MALRDLFKRTNTTEDIPAEMPPDIGGDAPVQRGKIGEKEVAEAMQTLQEYKSGKVVLEQRIIDNEQWFKTRHWDQIRRSKNPGDPEPSSAWLFNSIANKHADAMDNLPEPAVLPREQSDERDAKILSEILPVILEQNDFESVWSSVWWYKLKTGTGVYGVFWDNTKNNGLGDIDIRKIDLINLFWEPGITDIQKSRNLFHVDLIDRDVAEETYPQLKDKLATSTIDIAKYVHDDSIDTSKKVAVIDWYYKLMSNGREILHFCKFCNGKVLYASENDPALAETGWYNHGRYPFEFDNMFEQEGEPTSFGYLDIMKNCQMYIDKLDQVVLKHGIMAARPRWFVRGDGSVNEAEYADWTKDFVHYSGSGNPANDIMQINVSTLPGVYVDLEQFKISELKETSGNRDFNQGSAAGGVTSASGIAALQEAGAKTARDIIKRSYNTFRKINYLVIELIRQFYTEDRTFRILGQDGAVEYVSFNGQSIAAKPQGVEMGQDMGYRMPIFDIRVQSQKASPFSTTAQNERAIQLYQLGFFRPDLADQSLACLEMMQFEGIEKVKERVSQNGTLFQQVQQLQMQMQRMAQIIDAQNGTTIGAAMGEQMMQDGNTQTPRGEGQMDKTVGRSAGETLVNRARERANSNTSVQ